MKRIVNHMNRRFRTYDGKTPYKKLTAWEWKDEDCGLVILYFDGGEDEKDKDNWDRKKCIDIFKDDNFSILSELTFLVYES